MDVVSQTIQLLQDYSQIPGVFSYPLNAYQVLDIRTRVTQLEGFEESYPLMVKRYVGAKKCLVYLDQKGQPYLNPIALGQMIAILDLIIAEIHEPSGWQCIHPLIKKSSMELYLHEHYSDAAVDAFIEINDRVKQLFNRLKPDVDELDGVKLMNTVFSDRNAVVELGDLSAETGRNIQQGYRFMFAGAMSALRNPKAHSNKEVLDAFEAMRRIMFASMLMYKLDEIDENR